MIYTLLENHTCENAEPILLNKGDKVKVGRSSNDGEAWPGWSYCCSVEGNGEGWTPEQLIRIEGENGIILEDYSAKELDVHKGEQVEGDRELNGWLWCKRVDGPEEGWLPKEKLLAIGGETLSLVNGEVILRDLAEKDIDDYMEWYTEEMEWQQWDAPWEWEVSEEEKAAEVERMKRQLVEKLAKEPPSVRRKLEIGTLAGDHIGWVSSYLIDDDVNKRAVGIDIPSNKHRGKHLGEAALTLFVSYMLKSGLTEELYTQTWSGNERMIKLAEKCGFEIVDRKIGTRMVADNAYDALTFKLNKDLFWSRYPHLQA